MRAQRLTCSLTDRVLGACAVIAALIGINAWWVRAAFAAVGFTLGTGALIIWRCGADPAAAAGVDPDWPRPRPDARGSARNGYSAWRRSRFGLIVLARNLGVLLR